MSGLIEFDFCCLPTQCFPVALLAGAWLTPANIQDEARISVESEDEPDRILLNIQIKRDDSYAKQQGPSKNDRWQIPVLMIHLETLIVWTDPSGVDMALSFQESEGCGSVWYVYLWSMTLRNITQYL